MFITSSFITLSVADEDHSDADCLIVTVLSHGGKSSDLIAYDHDYKVEKLWKPFEGDKCPSLVGKPKIFIIQVSEFIFLIFDHVALQCLLTADITYET